MDSGQEQNYWPGFVDALSNVVLTLVFVLVIFVFALAMSSSAVQQKLEQAANEKIASAQQNTDKGSAELQQKLTDATKEIEMLQKSCTTSDKQTPGKSDQDSLAASNNGASIVIENKAEDKTKEGFISFQQSGDGLTLVFPNKVAEIDDKAASKLQDILAKIQKNIGNQHKVLLRSIMGNEGYSAARRMAYYRAVAVRNMLITKMGVNPALISSTIVASNKPEEGRVQIIFTKN